MIDWRGAGGGTKTGRDIMDGWISIVAKDDHFFVGVVRQLLLSKRTEAWSDVCKGVEVGQASVRAERRAHGHQPRSWMAVRHCLSGTTFVD